MFSTQSLHWDPLSGLKSYLNEILLRQILSVGKTENDEYEIFKYVRNKEILFNFSEWLLLKKAIFYRS